MIKNRLNIKNIIVLVVVLLAIHFSTGLFLSPIFSRFVIDKINDYGGTKIYIEKAAVWPLTLSFSLKNLKFFDPEQEDKRIIDIQNASFHISPLGLLAKRLAISSINIGTIDINLEGEPDGTFNIQRLAKLKKSEEKEGLKLKLPWEKKKDIFGTIYDILKKKFSKQAAEKQKTQQQEAKQIIKTTTELPKGRIVHFKNTSSYLVQIKNINLKNAHINIKTQDNRTIDIDKAQIELGDIYFDPELGIRFGKLNLAANVNNEGVTAGNIRLSYTDTFKGNKGRIDVKLNNIDLDVVRSFYEDSLPVKIVKGTLSLSSETSLYAGNIESNTSLSLSNHELEPKSGLQTGSTFMPMPLLCDNLNKINPVKLNFKIDGSIDAPQFSGLLKSLSDLVGPNIKEIAKETVKTKTIGALQGFLKTQQTEETPR